MVKVILKMIKLKIISCFNQTIDDLKILERANIFQHRNKNGLSHESIKPSTTFNNNLHPSSNYNSTKIQVKFDGRCLKQDKFIFNHKTVLNIYIGHEINLCLFKLSSDFTLQNYFFETFKLKMSILTNIDNLDIVLNLMHAEVFRYLVVVGLVKT